MDTTNTDACSIERNLIARKPRLALMGEFSAGKSTLSNLLLGSARLPVRITATRLPPVWISYGEEKAIRVDLDGNETQLDIREISSIQLEETKMLKLFLNADILEICDLIDMPGISDPNMASSVWEDALSEVDSVVWCTHATQAWRQSEAAAWDLVRSKTNGDNLIVISQFDKLRSERDKSRVLERVLKETDGLFRGVFPVSLIDALNSGEDVEKWKQSGAASFTEKLVEQLLSPTEMDMTPDILTEQIGSIMDEDPLESANTQEYFESSGESGIPNAEAKKPSFAESDFCENPSKVVVTPRRVRPNRKDGLQSSVTITKTGADNPSAMMMGAAEGE